MSIIIRLASYNDLEPIESLMKSSMRTLGIGYYSNEQIESCRQFVCVPDRQLIEDKTFFVAENETGKLIGCGGWSFRNKLYAGPAEYSQESNQLNPSTDPGRIRAMFTDPNYSGKGIGSMILHHSEQAAKEHGFSKIVLGSTLSGFSFYKAKGWVKVSEEQSVLPNGIVLQVINMEKYL